jgi:hypothetical protein
MAKNELKSALIEYTKGIENLVDSNPDTDPKFGDLFTNFGVSGCVLMELFESDDFKKNTGFKLSPDTIDKAKLLLELGIQAMITRWFISFYKIHGENSYTDQQKEEDRRSYLTCVQQLLGLNSDAVIGLYLGFDKEWQWATFGNYPNLNEYAKLFYHRYCECITGERVDWKVIDSPMFVQYDPSQKFYYKNKLISPLEPSKAFRTYFAIGLTIVMFGKKLVELTDSSMKDIQ